MIKHIVLWKLTDQLTKEEKNEVVAAAKKHLEGLKGKIDGLIDIQVEIDPLASSNVDLMLDSTFASEEALANYAVHPEHVAVADAYVRPYIKTRSCIDFGM